MKSALAFLAALLLPPMAARCADADTRTVLVFNFSVLDDEDSPEPMAILRSMREDASADSSEAPCPHCGESVPANLTLCRKCEKEMTS